MPLYAGTTRAQNSVGVQSLTNHGMVSHQPSQCENLLLTKHAIQAVMSKPFKEVLDVGSCKAHRRRNVNHMVWFVDLQTAHLIHGWELLAVVRPEHLSKSVTGEAI